MTDRDYFEPVPKQCSHCDFGTGQRGMDSCGKCGGTGSVFWVAQQRFPNTESGYMAARALLIGAPR